MYVDDKPTYHKSFSDGKHGGKVKGLAAALNYRDKIIRRMKSMGDMRRPYTRRKPTARSTTGCLGISYQPKSHKNNATYRCFFITDEGIRKNLSFSIVKFDDDLAFALACKSRFLKRRATERDL